MLVFDDADVSAVAETIKMAASSTRPGLHGATRIIAGARAYEGLLSELVPAVQSIRSATRADDAELDRDHCVSSRSKRVIGFVDRERACYAPRWPPWRHQRDRGYFYQPTIV